MSESCCHFSTTLFSLVTFSVQGNTPVLNWIQRLNIATGTARGLQFLHNREKPLIHGDIKR